MKACRAGCLGLPHSLAWLMPQARLPISPAALRPRPLPQTLEDTYHLQAPRSLPGAANIGHSVQQLHQWPQGFWQQLL